jgi:GR25 family glycosyltransferase involved in LPS biosynthesis
MKAYCITIKDHKISEKGFLDLQKSSKDVKNDFEVERFDAAIQDNVRRLMEERMLIWNYPWVGSHIDNDTRLRKTAYGTRIKERRMACSMSHFILWENCVKDNVPYLVLEHDAVFVHKLNYEDILNSKYGIVGLNDPHMATRLYNKFDSIVKNNPEEYQDVPIIDRMEVPQGLAGNSAYIIKPDSAKHLIGLCYKYGLWPNDAIMCQQLVPNMGVTKTYYTKTQQLGSTTSN